MAHGSARPEESGAPPAHHRRGPSTIALLIAASVTVVALAVVVVPRVTGSDGDTDREIDTYTVRLGDTISSVAQLHATTAEAVEQENDLTPASSIDPGSQITIPLPEPTGRGLPPDLAANGDLLRLRATFEKWAEECNVPAALLEANAWQESAWDNDTLGEDGAVGISQLAPTTIDFINEELVDGPALDPTDPSDNIELMAIYVDYLLEQTDGSWAATLAAYRVGLSASQANAWETDTTNYITAAMSLVPDFEAN